MRRSRTILTNMEDITNVSGELIDTLSWAPDKDNNSFMMVFRSWLSNNEGTTDLFLDVPYHQDFYEIFREYCDNYEEYMLEKFEKK